MFIYYSVWQECSSLDDLLKYIFFKNLKGCDRNAWLGHDQRPVPLHGSTSITDSVQAPQSGQGVYSHRAHGTLCGEI